MHQTSLGGMPVDLSLLEETLAPLLTRRSASPKRLAMPAPDFSELDMMIQAALRAPDHGGLHPWRIIEFRDSERAALAERFEQEKLRRDPLASKSDLAKAREHATRPPMLLGFVVCPRVRTKVPQREQVVAAGAALANLLNAAHQLGYGASILSGERCFDPELVRQLGLGAEEWLAGFVSIGTIREAPPPARQSPSAVVWSCWMASMAPKGVAPAGLAPVSPAVPDLLAQAAARLRAVGSMAVGSDVTYEQARSILLDRLVPLADAEVVDLDHARGRVLAHDVLSGIDVPAHDNSAMDGYAFDGRDLSASTSPTVLRVVGDTVLAGEVHAGEVPRGACVRIMTGAAMPPGLDTVAPVEVCVLDGERLSVAAGAVRRGDHRRLQGEDLRRGGVALTAGRRLRPSELGLMASLGMMRVEVVRRLRVALLSTGNELQSPGEALREGQIYDSNRQGLRAALEALGVDVIDLGAVRDHWVDLLAAVDRAVQVADVLVTTGGVGEGDADLVGRLLRERGETVFRHVAMRPGHPVSCGQLPRAAGEEARGKVWHFALPGNPVAALVSFHVLARDALLALSGATPAPPPLLRARVVVPIRKRAGRTEFQRGVVSAVDGVLEVVPTVVQGSGILRSLSEANALIVLRHDQGPVSPGETVDVWMLDEQL